MSCVLATVPVLTSKLYWKFLDSGPNPYPLLFLHLPLQCWALKNKTAAKNTCTSCRLVNPHGKVTNKSQQWHRGNAYFHIQGGPPAQFHAADLEHGFANDILDSFSASSRRCSLPSVILLPPLGGVMKCTGVSAGSWASPLTLHIQLPAGHPHLPSQGITPPYPSSLPWIFPTYVRAALSSRSGQEPVPFLTSFTPLIWLIRNFLVLLSEYIPNLAMYFIHYAQHIQAIVTALPSPATLHLGSVFHEKNTSDLAFCCWQPPPSSHHSQ